MNSPSQKDLTPLQKDLIYKESEFGADTYKPLPVVLSKGSGVWLWDVDGNKYLDMAELNNNQMVLLTETN